MDKEIIKEGTVSHIVYSNEDNQFTIFEIIDEDDNEELTCTGYISNLAEGEYVKLIGKSSFHATYGPQFNVSTYEKSTPTTAYGIEKYLASGIIKGIGQKTAKKIVKRFGLDTLNVIEKEPDSLAEITGITLKKAREIHTVFIDEIAVSNIMIFLQSYDISTTNAMKIYKRYKADTIDVVNKNPYVLADDINGISFKIADAIAIKLGVDMDSPFRLKAAIKHVMLESINNGNVCIPKETLYREVNTIIRIDEELFEDLLKDMQFNSILMQKDIEDRIYVYLNMYFYSENYIAKKLIEMSMNAIDKSDKAEKEIKSYEKKNGIALANKQRDAVIEALSQSILVITGGPGTGKTTTIKTIIALLESEGYDVLLAAPTGRAAKRMEEATGMKSSTIHRLLEISFSGDDNQTFEKNEENPLEADVVILDESSMIDNMLMYHFLKAIEVGTRVILVGDMDQLPSVGAGNILKDIINSNRIKVVKLDEIFRQAKTSQIVVNAHKVNRGEYPDLNVKNSDFYFVERSNIENLQKTIVDLVTYRLPKFEKCDMSSIQVLSPMRKSPLGVASLNQVLQEAINPPAKNKKEKEYRNIVFREGDRIMQIKNNYNITWASFNEETETLESGSGIYNGDEGVIKSINENLETFTIIFDDSKKVEYDFKQLDELELSYAITIHKSQGSEYPVVVIPVHSGPQMLLNRNLLYTAITRGKNLVVIVGTKNMLNFMVDNNREWGRNSNLDYFINEFGELFENME